MLTSFTYRYINIPNFEQIAKEIAASDFSRDLYNFRIINHNSVLEKIPTLANWFKDKNLIVSKLAFLNVRQASIQTLHIDTGDNDLALNFPVYGCEGVFTEFYKNKGQIVESFVPHTGVKYYRYVDDNPELLSTYVLTRPTLLNVKIPHRVVNKTDHDRICYSFRFKTDPWHLLEELE